VSDIYGSLPELVDRRVADQLKTPGRHGFYTYVPRNLPRALDLSGTIVQQRSEADRALGRLAGAARLLQHRI
jgi:hypothetical protein